MDILIVTCLVLACIPLCAWRSPKYKRRIGIALIASADADYYRKLNYAERVAQLTEEHSKGIGAANPRHKGDT